jgi:FtsH-binding integral membrane protein
MWNGIGWIAGLLALALIVWQALRLANIELELGITPAMITAALAALLLLFTFIRWIDSPSGFDRTIWAWLGLALAIVVAVGAWMNMQASGESLADVRASVAGAAAAAKGAVDRDKPAAAPPATPEAPAAAPVEAPVDAPVETPVDTPAESPAEPVEPDDTPRAS